MLETLYINNGTAILRDKQIENATVACQDGIIKYVGTKPKPLAREAVVVDARGGYISPGFIDIHVHGGAGADFMDGTPDSVRTVCQAHARHGTTTIFPTTTTGSTEQIEAMLDASRIIQQSADCADGASIGGVHLYGPYFAPDKVGCHSVEGCREPTAAEFNRYFSSGIVRIATCAAELPGAASFYRQARRQGCLITCGHSNSSWSEMESAFKLGMRHVDHFWCAMSNVSSVRNRLGVPMQGSMLEFVLSNPEMSTEVIADGWHLAPELLSFALQMKTAKRLCLVTDCNRALDMPVGKYRFGNDRDGSWFESDGHVGRAAGGNLASSIVGMDQMVRQMYRATKAPLHEVIRMATLTPAELTGIDRQTGSLEVGKRADLLVLSPQLKVRRVLIRGREFS